MKATGLRRHRKTQHGRKVRLVARKCEKKKKKCGTKTNLEIPIQYNN